MRAGNLILTVLMLMQSIAFVTPTAKAGLIINDDALYIALGATFSNVGWIETASSTYGNYRASGVLIDPHWVLTAGHVVQETGNRSTIYDTFTFGLGQNSISNRGETMSASKVFVEPSFNGVGRGYDLALLYFDTPFTTVAPIDRYFGDIAVGMDSYLVGYGTLQTAGQAATTQVFTGDRRAGNNVVTAVPSSLSRLEYIRTTIRSEFFPDFFRELQMGLRPGDSGGALIIDGKLAGIASIYAGDGFGALTDYSRLNNSWIDATIASQAVPEPCTCILLTAALSFYLAKRKMTCSTITN